MSEDLVQDRELAGRLREIREEVRQDTAVSRKAMSDEEEEGFLYGDRDLALFPQLRQHLGELDSLYVVREQPFTSRLPLIGPLIAWFRDRWNRIATKWYVRPLLEQQVRFNAAVVTVLQDLYEFHRHSSLDVVRRMDALFEPLDQGRAEARAWLRDLQNGHEELAKAIRELQQRVGDTGWQVLALEESKRQLTHQQSLDRRAMTFVRTELDRLMASVAGRAELTPEECAEIDRRREALYDYDYFRFEDCYRPPEVVREAQRVYLPFFEGRNNVLDLGCGKGEFLEMLREEGIEAYGVDLNEPMVKACEEKGLAVLRADALEHLAGLPDESLGGLFAAHLVEHLSPRALLHLTQLALAKLQPEAHLIFETPNPLCVWALVNYFYLDLSHVKPIHPQALCFLLQMQGFHDIEVRYLHPVPEQTRLSPLPEAVDSSWQEAIELLNQNIARLNDLLYGFNDYAVIARK